MRRAALAALAPVALLALAGCQSLAPASTDDESPASSARGSHLQAAGVAFDPVADDVAGIEACDGISGDEELESFDRAAWPDLDIAGGDAVLECGNAQGAGWRHIAEGHTGDYGELAELVDASWEDVAWFAIDEALESPTNVEMYRDDIANYDLLVEYVGESGDVERSWIVTVGVGLTSGDIITSFPDEQH